MIQLHEFDGGIHPPENKQQSTRHQIQQSPVPQELILPLHQHIGLPSEPVVSIGDTVLKGQVIAQAQGTVSAQLHAPTSGTITAIEERPVPHASGLTEICIVLSTDGKEEWQPHQSLMHNLDVERIEDIPAIQLLEHIALSGIVGLGGAGFPTATKLSTDPAGIHTLILNGAECEPYITADDMLMREQATEVISGAHILLHILQAETCLIAVEDNKPEAIAALQAAALECDNQAIQVITIPTKYPSGGEKQLIQILTGKEVPSGSIPASLGIVCQNVGTAAAIHQAVHLGKPLISRITTVTGNAQQQPGNWQVLLGTPVEFLLQQAGYQPQAKERVIMGGPMMGFTLPSLSVPVVKTTNCLLAPDTKELPLNDIATACIRCGMCAQACPADLLPQQLYWFSKAQEFEKAEQHNLFDCIECGACSYVCPSHIPLVQYYRYAKGVVKEEQAAQLKSEKAKERFEQRLARQEREQAEKDARRKARTDAAAKAKSSSASAVPSVASNASAPAAQTASASSPIGREKLEKQLAGAQTALSKTREKLDTAKADPNMADKVAAFEAALAKTQAKIQTLKEQLAAAPQASGQANADRDKGDPNSPERLKKKWETAQLRLETAQKRLQEAQEQGLDTVEALQNGLDKQQVRVDEAKAAYQNSQSSEAVSSDDTDEQQKKIRAQQDRVDKARERLAMAQEQQLDTVDALQKAVDKQQLKLDALTQHTSEA